jgi:hypothetical protein
MKHRRRCLPYNISFLRDFVHYAVDFSHLSISRSIAASIPVARAPVKTSFIGTIPALRMVTDPRGRGPGNALLSSSGIADHPARPLASRVAGDQAGACPLSVFATLFASPGPVPRSEHSDAFAAENRK